ncbi:hypothetical protein HWD35_12840 [Tsukamurella tyrosinosolvens]|uniref:hypothetical protein n=1 Tax=Tsukamurella tyrosinosolvens TaxID=57704 RepID=UPI00079929B1|nr:hypothetical protein [Tsukamurella tyrosinosolvens]AUN41192.1 hypothetical protein ASU32_15255 [Tsukamurella tyrosinosolvens]KXO99946.1 hypothetical protein AXK58_01775 [Tsukamurella tyrosinosolvens]KXP04527.1 hypothetical protein AXK59_14065 [Tsukamurella tyrosinosolvens]KZL97780.1 hypothetical protein AXX05_02265 [Tsukamurella tyrosinosolvens]MCA4995598.1 hypothetical protein [Tsukamurella tyrosinosolvens]
MLDHYDVRGGEFNLGIRPPAGRRAGLGVWRVIKAVLNSAAELDVYVCAARHGAHGGGWAPS